MLIGNVKKLSVRKRGLVFCKEIRLWAFQSGHELQKNLQNGKKNWSLENEVGYGRLPRFKVKIFCGAKEG